ncbi:MAG: hypothetical protein GF344_05965 [Chitinivibrionales bacterium]|nr:hypothetical protein [Chitinivibrionales bacterium]
MSEKERELAIEIEDEAGLLEELGAALKATYHDMPLDTKHERVYRESLALKLHNFYTGCERIFCRISEELNGGLPKSHDWHVRLLRKMTLEIEGIRPAVLSRETASILDEYRSFRHVVRNIYGFEIKMSRMKPLLDSFDTALIAVRKDLSSFVGFLRKAG